MLQYDPAAVEILSVEQGSFFIDPDGDGTQEGFLFLPEQQDPVDGYLGYDATWQINFNQGGVATGTDANGSGPIAVFKVLVKNLGSGTDLQFVTTDHNGDGAPDTRLFDYNRLPLLFQTRDGRIAPRD